jgi:choline dehydrogenase
MDREYDYIVVGAGSAGCVVANRLSREASNKVLLLEAGGKDLHPMIHIPLGAITLQKTKLDWCYETEPEPELENRRIKWPRGKVLGGSSCLHGMIYIRGQKEDFDKWAEMGNPGWSYADLLPYFRLHEHNTNGADQYHGSSGPLWVGEVAGQFDMAEQFVKAGVQAGIPLNPDFNGKKQEGIGYFPVNIKNGIRQSSVSSHLRPVRNRPNLTIETHALARKVLIENGKAVGVSYQKKGQAIEARCRGEVILCGGTVNSPQLLELSGIGDSERLQRTGIEVKHHLAGVGENLQDHLTVNVCYSIKGHHTYYEEMKPLRFIRQIFDYFFKRKGMLAFPAAQVGAFFKTNPQMTRPNAQIHFAPAAAEYNDKGNMVPRSGSTATVCYLRPSSRGSVHARSSNPEQHPEIKANYLNTEEDKRITIEAVKKTRSIFATDVLKPFDGHEMTPGIEVQTDEQILEYIRKDAVSVYHPVGSCKMGNDEMSVVDHRLRVHGIGGLRVADASIMPTIVSGNTHAACVVIADKCADMILEDSLKLTVKER